MVYRSIRLLIKKYYQLRYWNAIYNQMAKTIKIDSLSREKKLPYINKPGIAFSFDDSYRVYEWYKFGKPIFDKYDIKVTFNINGVNPLEENRFHTQNEIDLLLELQSDGHEIANHSFEHKKATDYSDSYGVGKWIEDEIESMNNWMKKQTHSKTGVKFNIPVSFAFPHFLFNDKTTASIIPKYFKIARGHMNQDNLTSFNHIGLAPSICLDGYYSCSLFFVKKILKLVKKSGKNIIFTCHSILPDNFKAESDVKNDMHKKWNNWRISTNTIQKIICEAVKLDMEFYTTSEIAGIAIFPDDRFERSIREMFSLQGKKWIEIQDLIHIKELDLSHKRISKIDGIQYFKSLEKLDLSNNLISDFKMLSKLPRLKQLNIDNNVSLINEKIV